MPQWELLPIFVHQLRDRWMGIESASIRHWHELTAFWSFLNWTEVALVHASCAIKKKKKNGWDFWNCLLMFIYTWKHILANINKRLVTSPLQADSKWPHFKGRLHFSFPARQTPLRQSHRPWDFPLNRMSFCVWSWKSLELLRFYDGLTLIFNVPATTLSDESRWARRP